MDGAADRLNGAAVIGRSLRDRFMADKLVGIYLACIPDNVGNPGFTEVVECDRPAILVTRYAGRIRPASEDAFERKTRYTLFSDNDVPIAANLAETSAGGIAP